GELGHGVGQAEDPERDDLVGDDPHDRADRVALDEHVDPEPADTGDGVRGVELEIVLEALPLLLGEDGVHQLPDLRPVEHRILGERRHLAPEADDRMAAGGQVEVGPAEVDDAAQDVVDVEGDSRGPERALVGPTERLGGEGDAQRCVVGFGFVHSGLLVSVIGPGAGSLEELRCGLIRRFSNGAVHYPWASLGTSSVLGAVEAETGWWARVSTRLSARLTLGLTEGEPLFPLVVLFGLNAVDELDKTAFNVLAPEIRRSFDLGISGVLGLVAVIELVAILLGLPLAYWADRRSRVRLARRGATLWGTFSLATGLAPNVGLLAAARAGAGMGRAVVTPTHFSLLADYYPPEIRSKVFGTHRAANSVGQFIGPILAGGLALWLGWRAPFVLFVVPTMVFVTLAHRLSEPARGAHERRAAGATEEACLTEEEPPRFLAGCRELWKIRSLRRVWYALPFAATVIVGFG